VAGELTENADERCRNRDIYDASYQDFLCIEIFLRNVIYPF
jgi:hypothetical protein